MNNNNKVTETLLNENGNIIFENGNGSDVANFNLLKPKVLTNVSFVRITIVEYKDNVITGLKCQLIFGKPNNGESGIIAPYAISETNSVDTTTKNIESILPLIQNSLYANEQNLEKYVAPFSFGFRWSDENNHDYLGYNNNTILNKIAFSYFLLRFFFISFFIFHFSFCRFFLHH
jgi:hypothetical protein